MICGFQHPQRSGRGIARIGEAGQPALVAVGVQALEGAPVHHGLAAHFELRQAGLHAQGQRADGARILGHLFADHAVAARDRLRKLAVAIVRGHGKSVQLQFGHVQVFGAAQQFAHAAVEIAQLAFVQRIVQAQHGRAVRHLDEALARLAAHALGRRIGREQARDVASPVPAIARIRTSYSASLISGWSST